MTVTMFLHFCQRKVEIIKEVKVINGTSMMYSFTMITTRLQIDSKPEIISFLITESFCCMILQVFHFINSDRESVLQQGLNFSDSKEYYKRENWKL